MPPLKLALSLNRGRNWIWVALAVSAVSGCIRFRNDAPADAGLDTANPLDAESEAGDEDAGDVVVLPPPICERDNPPDPQRIAGDLITEVTVNDCRLRRHFEGLPPIALEHLQECLTAQIGQVMGCRRLDGEPYKYPTIDSKGRFCRDMKSSHMGMTLSDGDFDAFIAGLDKALPSELEDTARKRVLGVFGATRNDMVRLKDAGPTLPCDAPDAG
jgi:hypothetical protein